MKAYTNARIFTGENYLEDCAVLVDQGFIKKIVTKDNVPSDYIAENLNGMNLAPAFIDMQIYGGNGKMFSHDLSVESLQATYEYCLSGGAAHFMITMATNSIEKFLTGIDKVKEYWQQGGKGLLGLHLEGPYINPIKKGAHIEQYIKRPERKEVEMLLERGKGVFKMMTLAPEQCDPEIIELLIRNNIIVSAGHTNATFQQASHALNNGIPAATHLFNAMSQFQSREPGMVGAIYDHPSVQSSVVCDGVHVDFAAIRISKEIMKDRLFFITDAVAETTVGEYQHIFHGDRYCLPNGTLSGSALTMMKCVVNGIEKVKIQEEEALRMASLYPARLLGDEFKLGKIEPGYKADFVIYDEELNVKKVVTA